MNAQGDRKCTEPKRRQIISIHSLRVSPGTQTDVTVNITQVMEAHCQNIKRRNLERTGNIFNLQLSISFPELTRLK